MAEISRAVPFCFIILFSEQNVHLIMITSIWVFNKYLLLVFMAVIEDLAWL